MQLSHSRNLSALALSLILGTMAPAAQPATGPRILAPAQLAYHRSQQTQRAAFAQDHLQSFRPMLGLSGRENFRVAKAFTNEIGEAIVHLDHLYDGHRVLGSQAIARVPLGGAVEAITHSVTPGVQVSGEPRLSPEQAAAAAIKRLDPKGFMQDAPRVEPVVFPARLLGGIETLFDPATGAHHVDRAGSVQTKLASPYVWAYEVQTRLHNPQDGLKELTYYIDAGTGAVLRVVDHLHRQAAPVTGAGKGLYIGSPSIPASRMVDGTFSLYDPTRGTAPNPALQGYTPDGSGWTPTGLQVWYESHDGSGAPTGTAFLFQSNPANTWGDGLLFTAWGSENGTNGQTAGVDAMYGMALTWDLFQNVFGRVGMDGAGTSSFAEVLLTSPNDRDNAYWSNWAHGLYLGAGSYPADPTGFGAFTELDVVAHEMTHGITASTAQFTNSPGYEEAGLNEGTSDFFAQMAKAYATRAPGASASEIPEAGADWRMGYQVGHGTPLRWMDKPSRDNRSVDAWYDGLYYLDGHYSCGVLNRALFFLAQGASSNPADANYSPYLPQGMTGLGNDKAARIWFKTVTERLASGHTGSITYADAREQAIAAAKQLYGYTPKGYPWDCPESEAVENAFAAANVGRAYGEDPRIQVRFADWRNNDYIQRNHASESGWSHKQFLPMGEAVRPRVTVLNTTNTAVSWSLGGPSVYNNGAIPGGYGWVTAGGVINADGTWTTPKQVGWFAITATSQADPRQFAEGRAFIVNLDADQDGESDAVDMGAAAFSWAMWPALNPSHSPLNQPAVGDEDVAIFPDAIKFTWWMK